MVPYEGFFYPLDAVLHWNRLYGRSGFVQYQCVLPKAAGGQGLVEILRRISQRGRGSFLAVLKLFGPQDSLISFPMEGYTLALDFPIRRGLWRFWTTSTASCLPTVVACTSRKMPVCIVTCSGTVIRTARNFSLLCKNITLVFTSGRYSPTGSALLSKQSDCA